MFEGESKDIVMEGYQKPVKARCRNGVKTKHENGHG
jgi:hypothetical protein